MKDLTTDFTLTDLDGNLFTLSDQLKKSAVLLVFYKYDCPTCQYTLPYLEKLWQKHGPDQVQFAAIAQDGKSQAEQFKAEYNISFPILIDQEPYKVSNLFDFEVVPMTVLFNQNGSQAHKFIAFQKNELEQLNLTLARNSAEIEPFFDQNEDIPELKPG